MMILLARTVQLQRELMGLFNERPVRAGGGRRARDWGFKTNKNGKRGRIRAYLFASGCDQWSACGPPFLLRESHRKKLPRCRLTLASLATARRQKRLHRTAKWTEQIFGA
jgi:hypothetical protein